MKINLKICYLVLIAITFFLSGFSYAQTEISTDIIIVPDEKPSDWVVYKAHNDFQIEFQYQFCDPEIGYDSEYIFFRITNNSNETLQLEWQLDLYYDDNCFTCSYAEEYGYTVILNPYQTIMGSCDLHSDYQLKVFSRFVEEQAPQTQLTAFKLNNLLLN